MCAAQGDIASSDKTPVRWHQQFRKILSRDHNKQIKLWKIIINKHVLRNLQLCNNISVSFSTTIAKFADVLLMALAIFSDIIVVSLLMRLMTLYLVSLKITTIDDFTALALLRPSNYRFNFLFYWYAPRVFFLRSWMRFRVPHLCSKIPKMYNWSMDSGVHSVCFGCNFAIKSVVEFLR